MATPRKRTKRTTTPAPTATPREPRYADEPVPEGVPHIGFGMVPTPDTREAQATVYYDGQRVGTIELRHSVTNPRKRQYEFVTHGRHVEDEDWNVLFASSFGSSGMHNERQER